MQQITIIDVQINPNPVSTAQAFTISVDVRPSTHGFLKRFTHAALKAFTHKDVAYSAHEKKER